MYRKTGEILFQVICYAGFSIFAFSCLFPFYYVLIYSLSDPMLAYKVTFVPVSFTFINYRKVFELGIISKALVVSISRAITGTILTVFASSLLAYVFTKKEMPMRKSFYRLTVIALYFSAGLIPYYMTMRAYGLKDSFLLYILPSAIIPFYVVLIKTFIEQLPSSLEESALIDGANYFKIYLYIILPLSLPVLAAVGVFSAVNQWNSWFDNFLLVKNPNLQTLQYTLLTFLRQADAIAKMANINMNDLMNMRISPTSLRMAITMIVVIPVACVYPFLQRYFVKGILLGAVKG
jgi:putative aldouronate transport system permease protein